MNTDKIYAETLASEYAPKDTSKVTALKKLDRKSKITGRGIYLYIGNSVGTCYGTWNVPVYAGNWCRYRHGNIRNHTWHYRYYWNGCKLSNL